MGIDVLEVRIINTEEFFVASGLTSNSAVFFFDSQKNLVDIHFSRKESLEEKLTKIKGKTFSEYWDETKERFSSISWERVRHLNDDRFSYLKTLENCTAEEVAAKLPEINNTPENFCTEHCLTVIFNFIASELHIPAADVESAFYNSKPIKLQEKLTKIEGGMEFNLEHID